MTGSGGQRLPLPQCSVAIAVWVLEAIVHRIAADRRPESCTTAALLRTGENNEAFQAVGQACKAIFWPTPGLKGRTFTIFPAPRTWYNFWGLLFPIWFLDVTEHHAWIHTFVLSSQADKNLAKRTRLGRLCCCCCCCCFSETILWSNQNLQLKKDIKKSSKKVNRWLSSGVRTWNYASAVAHDKDITIIIVIIIIGHS